MLLVRILTAVTIISLIPLIGLAVLLTEPLALRKKSFYFIGFSAGALIGTASLHLLPHAFKALPHASIYFLVGFLAFFGLSLFLAFIQGKADSPTQLVLLFFLGDFFHNFLDGIAITGSFTLSTHLGIITAVTVAVHEIPQKLSNFVIMLNQGLSIPAAVGLNILSGLSTFAGAAGAYYLDSLLADKAEIIIAATAGAFLYLATANLIPLMQQQKATSLLGQLISFACGIGVIVFLEQVV